MSSDGNENWVMGVVLGLLGSIAINTGNNIQSLGLKKLQERCDDVTNTSTPMARRGSLSSLLLKDSAKTVPIEVCAGGDEVKKLPPSKRSPYSSKIWLVGTVIFVSGSLLNFASYAFAAQSMLASLESIQFVTNLAFGKLMLGANVTKTMILGTCLTVMGTILAVQFSSKATLDLNTDQIKQLYLNAAYMTYIAIMVVLLVALHFVYRILERLKKQGRPLRFTEVMMPLVYSIWSALFGTQSVVQAKVMAELLAVHSAGEENVFRSWFTFVTLALWIATVGVWLKRLNDALSMFNPLFIIPLLQCSFIFFAIISGGIFFKEFNTFTSSQWVGFWCGVSVMFSGLALLTPKKKKQKDDLPREVIDLLLSSGGVGTVNGMNAVRPPLSPAPTPRHDLDVNTMHQIFNKKSNESNLPIATTILNVDNKPDGDLIKTIPAVDEGKDSKCIAISGKDISRRNIVASPREFGITVREVVRESARQVVNGSNLLLTANNGTDILTNAMVSATVEKEKRIHRREKLKRLQALIVQNRHVWDSGGICHEATKLVQDLKLDLDPIITSGSNDRNLEPSPTFSSQSLEGRVLWELEEVDTPSQTEKNIGEQNKGFNTADDPQIIPKNIIPNNCSA